MSTGLARLWAAVRSSIGTRRRKATLAAFAALVVVLALVFMLPGGPLSCGESAVPQSQYSTSQGSSATTTGQPQPHPTQPSLTTTTQQRATTTSATTASADLVEGMWDFNFMSENGSTVASEIGLMTLKAGTMTPVDADSFRFESATYVSLDAPENAVTIEISSISSLDNKPMSMTWHCIRNGPVLTGWVESDLVTKSGSSIKRSHQNLTWTVRGTLVPPTGG